VIYLLLAALAIFFAGLGEAIRMEMSRRHASVLTGLHQRNRSDFVQHGREPELDEIREDAGEVELPDDDITLHHRRN
jgi:hypothetical protein